MTVQTARIIRSVTALYALFLVAIVYTANAGIEHPGSVFVRNLPWGDKMGHIVLFGALTFVVNLALRCRTIRLGRFAVPIGTLLVSAVVVIEELSQGFLSNRTPDVADLAADAIGIVLATLAAVGFWALIQRRRSATEPSRSTTVGDVNPTDHAGAAIAESVGDESVVHMTDFVETVDVDEGSISRNSILDSAFPGHAEPEVEPQQAAPVFESDPEVELEPPAAPVFEPDPEVELESPAAPVFESESDAQPEPEFQPELIAEFDTDPEPEHEPDPEPEHEPDPEPVFYLDGDVEIDEPGDAVNEVDSITETSDEPSSDSENVPDNESESADIDGWVAMVVPPVEHVDQDEQIEPDEARGPIDGHESEEETAEVDVAIDMTAIELAADAMLPTMADLDEVSADLDRIDAALVALDWQR